MDLDENRKKRKKKKLMIKIYSAVVIALVVFVLFITVYDFGYKKYVAKLDILEDTIKCDSVIIENSIVYKSNHTGTVNYFKNEGDKISKGILLARTYATNEDDMQSKLDELNKQIKKIESNSIKSEILSSDIKKSEKIINYIVKDLQESLLNGDFKKAKEIKSQLVEGVDKHNKITGNDSYKNVTVSTLVKQKENIIKQMQSNTKNYYSKNVGIISYLIDGLESTFTLENILNTQVDKIEITDSKPINNKEIEKVKIGQPVLKVAYNNKWYIGCKLKKESINGIKEGNNIDIRFNDKIRLKAVVYKIKEQGDNALVIFSFDDYYYKVYKNRFNKVDIIKSSNKGLKIPIDSIIEREGKKGVFVSNVSNIVKFVPIKILYQNDEFAIVKQKYFYVKQKETDKAEKIDTIRLYDQIIQRPDKVKEKDILNRGGDNGVN
ncbi:HlyD family efflux transporter periplasmic adaptor subunit [Clostridiaceae bacterium M8S5]|nr:HlyD family efflux transporter periplasmic adaptor subunit [Clostridiaceae bacterium M8S5]